MTYGLELIGPFVGLEVGHSTRHFEGLERTGIHLGPFISDFGFVTLAGRFVVPTDDGAGEYGATVSFKVPLPLVW